MQETTKDSVINRNLIKSSLKIFAKVMFCVMVGFFFFVTSMFYLAPKINAKMFNFFGLTKAEESCYIQAYKNSEKTSDLYNLVLFEQEHSNTEKELYYINVLLSKNDYSDFCLKLNSSAIAKTEKNMYVYVGDVNAYLVNRKLKCMYQLNSKVTHENRSKLVVSFVRSCLAGENLTELSFSTYVSLVLQDETLTSQQKVSEFETFENLISTEETVSTRKLLTDREGALINKYINEKSESSKILFANALVKFYKAEYNYFKTLGETENNLQMIEDKYQIMLDAYNKLIKK